MSIEGFVEEARAYVAFINGAAAVADAERMHAARARLLALYAAGLALTTIDAPDVEPPARERRSVGWIFERDMYWMVFDPQEDRDAVAGFLGGDCSEIYDDIRDGLHLWDAGHREAAQWSWHFHFQHWGRHAIDALRALHGLCRWS